MPTSMFDLQGLQDAPLRREPFDHVIVPGFVRPEALSDVVADFPNIPSGGSYPLETLQFGAAFHRLTEFLQSEKMGEIVGQRFDLPLADRPTMLTVRGRSRATDGQIHKDSAGKLVTALLYFNDQWQADGGRLRLLRSPADIEDFAAEVPPDAGTLLVFRCGENAWHGHAPFEGERRSLQLNWVVGRGYLRKEQFRHRLSALFKRAKTA